MNERKKKSELIFSLTGCSLGFVRLIPFQKRRRPHLSSTTGREKREEWRENISSERLEWTEEMRRERERERGSHNKERACFPIGCICPFDLILSKIFTPFKQAIKRFLSLSLSLQGQPVIVEVDQWQCKNRGERAFIGKEKLSCRGG